LVYTIVHIDDIDTQSVTNYDVQVSSLPVHTIWMVWIRGRCSNINKLVIGYMIEAVCTVSLMCI
jgi:hypothetical protein